MCRARIPIEVTGVIIAIICNISLAIITLHAAIDDNDDVYLYKL
jgi:hypothetical protein